MVLILLKRVWYILYINSFHIQEKKKADVIGQIVLSFLREKC